MANETENEMYIIITVDTSEFARFNSECLKKSEGNISAYNVIEEKMRKMMKVNSIRGRIKTSKNSI